MFSNKNNRKSKPMQDSSNVPSINMISDGTKITGTLVTKKDFRLSGDLEGSLEVEGKCIVSTTARIKGDVIATDADIAGKVEGGLVVKNRLILRQSAVVFGDIQTKSLLVEEGARFEGACHMSSKPGEQSSLNGASEEPEKKTFKIKAVNE